MFNAFDTKHGNNPDECIVAGYTDGILQRKTGVLLKMPEVRQRISRPVLCAGDSTAVSGGQEMLREKFDLEPDAISGLCSGSPLPMPEIRCFTNLPILKSMEKDCRKVFGIIG